jgi:flagellar assembly protein FliH
MMSSAASRRFLFDVSFDGPLPSETKKPAKPEPPAITEAQLAEVRAKAFAEGRAAGLAEAEGKREAAVAETLHGVAERIAALFEARREVEQEVASASVELALTVVRKALPTMAKHAALDEVAALVRQCLEEAIDEPRIVVRVPDAIFDDAKVQLDSVAAAAGYAGKLIVFADDALQPEQARVEWADGGAERDLTRLMNEIDAAAKRAADLMTRGDDR